MSRLDSLLLLQTWAAESGLSFVKGNRQNSKIRIDFKHHDGPWGVLGKAWFPRVGKIEFENGENWINKLDPRNSKGQGEYSLSSRKTKPARFVKPNTDET